MMPAQSAPLTTLRPVTVEEFAHALAPSRLPSEVVGAAQRLTLDLLGVAAVGAGTAAGRIAREVAAAEFASADGGVPILFASEYAGRAGAAMAGAFAIDSIDAHDGYSLAKGHAGCATLPTVLAFTREGTGAEFLARMVLGYEIGCRAGMALHASAPDYHTSGAWMALACAAIGARALGLSPGATREALGIAEYHGPRSQMMRCIAHPTMVKDGSGWGAMAGVSAALMAARGFTGAPALTVEGPDVADAWGDLGERWLILDQYVKPQPVCRWAQPAIHAALALARGEAFAPDAIVAVEVRTFAAATCLTASAPRTTEEAQYSLPYPLAAALVRGAVGPREVLELGDRAILRVASLVRMSEEPAFTARFPARRFADVEIVLADGQRIASGPVEAIGDPERPLSPLEISAKFHAYAGPLLGAARADAIEAAVATLADQPVGPLLELLGPAGI